MQTIQITPSVKRFLVDQNDDDDSVGSVRVFAPFRVGRREGLDLCLTSNNVSGLHAEILEEDGELWLRDLNSTNGTFLNDQRISTTAKLRDGDSIVFGNRRFRVIQDDGSRTPMATVPTAEPTAPTESPKQKFQRLLDSGAIPFFQPIRQISTDSQRLIGYEVLGRSRIFGLKTPEQMFAAALPLEMESELSRVLRQRGLEAAKNELPEDLKLFVNTHPAEIASNALGKSLLKLREAYPSRPIVLELSETSFTDPSAFSKLRSVLKDLDIGLALQDFSAGKIHLAELNEIAPDIVKFDCALLQGVNRAPSKRQRLIRAMVKMVKEIGSTPMAEYIESSDEHESLIQLGFEYGQGFYYGRPVDVETVSTPAKKYSSEDPASKEALASVSGNLETSRAKQRPLDLVKEIEKQETASQVEQIEVASPETSQAKQSADGSNGSVWLMQQPKHHYTIQLMVSVSRDNAEQFIAKQRTVGEYSIVQKRGKKNDLFVVLFGVFEERAQAKKEVQSFKGQNIFPIIRLLSTVQKEVLKKHSENLTSSANQTEKSD